MEAEFEAGIAKAVIGTGVPRCRAAAQREGLRGVMRSECMTVPSSSRRKAGLASRPKRRNHVNLNAGTIAVDVRPLRHGRKPAPRWKRWLKAARVIPRIVWHC